MGETIMNKIDNFSAPRTFSLLKNTENKYIIISHSSKCSCWKTMEETTENKGTGTGLKLDRERGHKGRLPQGNLWMVIRSRTLNGNISCAKIMTSKIAHRQMENFKI